MTIMIRWIRPVFGPLPLTVVLTLLLSVGAVQATGPSAWVLIAVDTTPSVGEQRLAAIRHALSQTFRYPDTPQLPFQVAVAPFGRRLELPARFTADPLAAASATERMRISNDRSTRVMDSVAEGVAFIRQNSAGPGLKRLVVISDGDPSSGDALSSDDIQLLLKRSPDIVIDTLVATGTDPRRCDTRGLLAQLADLTVGRFFCVDAKDDLESLVRQLLHRPR